MTMRTLLALSAVMLALTLGYFLIKKAQVAVAPREPARTRGTDQDRFTAEVFRAKDNVQPSAAESICFRGACVGLVIRAQRIDPTMGNAACSIRAVTGGIRSTSSSSPSTTPLRRQPTGRRRE